MYSSLFSACKLCCSLQQVIPSFESGLIAVAEANAAILGCNAAAQVEQIEGRFLPNLISNKISFANDV